MLGSSPAGAVRAVLTNMGTTSQPTRRLVVGSPEDFRRAAEFGVTVQGITSRHRKQAERMGPGANIDSYLTEVKAFGATLTVESPSFERHESIWTSPDPREAAENSWFRVRISPDLILPEDERRPAEPIARRRAYVAQ